jgi:hypothetical protein
MSQAERVCLEELMRKRELFSWAASVGAAIPVATLMICEMYVFAAVISVLLAVSGIALMSWPERRRDWNMVVDDGTLGASDRFSIQTQGCNLR